VIFCLGVVDTVPPDAPGRLLFHHATRVTPGQHVFCLTPAALR
jgi:hypothetical protein